MHSYTDLYNNVNGSRDLGLKFHPSSMQLYCSVDASHAVHDDLKGHTGAILWVGDRATSNAPTEVISKKQHLVSASSTEAELVALCQGGESTLWTRDLLEELGFKQETTTIEQDNRSTIILANRGPGKGGNSKAIKVKYFWISQYIDDGSIKLDYVPTETLIADGFTKPLEPKRFKEWRARVLNIDGMI